MKRHASSSTPSSTSFSTSKNTKASLQAALKANRQLQAEIGSQLQEIHRRKRLNRQAAAHSLQRLTTTTESLKAIDKTNNASSMVPATSTAKDVAALFANNTDDDSTKLKIPGTAKRKFRYDSTRRWPLEYFVDPLASRPLPNADVIKRRTLEEENGFFYHTSPTWSKQEAKHLRDIVKEEEDEEAATMESSSNSGGQEEESTNPPPLTTPTTATEEGNPPFDGSRNTTMDWERVAQTLWQKRQAKEDKGLPVTALPRTAKDCQLYYQNVLAPKIPFTKEEWLWILEQVHDNSIADNNNEASSPSPPDWQAIADNNNSENNRTPWECFCQYQKRHKPAASASASTTTITTTTTEQDNHEFLLRYLALQGPQFVWDTLAATEVSARFLPTTTPRQVLNRTNQSLLHPGLETKEWNRSEERKLVLAMNLYHHHKNQNTTDEKQHSALPLAATHFPHRNAIQVTKKWNRQLNPTLDHTPFTKKEDELLKTMNTITTTTTTQSLSFSQLARQHFPQRSVDSVSLRWKKLVHPSNVVLQKMFGSAKKQWKNHPFDNNSFSPKDFVVQVQSTITKPNGNQER